MVRFNVMIQIKEEASKSAQRLRRAGPAFLLLMLPTLLSAQVATVRVEENLRSEPNGILLGQILPGTKLTAGKTENRWVEVVLEGWIWERSLQTRPGELDLIISASDGENLRDVPSGRVAARLGNGTRLKELERTTGWIRVRRTAWIWAPSIEMGTAAAPAARPAPPPAAAPARAVSPPPPVAPAGSPAPVAGGRATEWIRTEKDAPLLGTPDGDALGTILPGTELRLMSREGSWARVQVEGWIWAPAAEGEGAADSAIIPGVTASALRDDPERFRSRLVEMTLQFISVERAERVRTDFFEGEPFLLTRGGESGSGFVYVALSADRLPEVRGLSPLERIIVTGRVRTGSAGLTGSPIIDLVEFRRATGG